MAWNFHFFVLLAPVSFSANSAYVPGDKGAPWSEEEVRPIIYIPHKQHNQHNPHHLLKDAGSKGKAVAVVQWRGTLRAGAWHQQNIFSQQQGQKYPLGTSTLMCTKFVVIVWYQVKQNTKSSS